MTAALFGFKNVAEQSKGLMFKVWTVESRVRVKGLTERNQGRGVWAAEPGFSVKGLRGRSQEIGWRTEYRLGVCIAVKG